MNEDTAKVHHVERPVERWADLAAPAWGSDLVAGLLQALDIEYVALNPGSSFRGLHDSLVNFTRNQRPQILLCAHEEHAVAIAHGYAKVTGRPMAAALHSNVGLMHAAMAVFNSWCDRVPVLLLGGNGPVDASRRRPWIDWIHTTQDPSALLRPYLKWDNQPASHEACMEALLRAWQTATTSPCGPTYVALDVSLQEEPLTTSVALPDPARYQAAPPPGPHPAALAQIDGLVERARRPVLLLGRVSRCEQDWERRIRLAEALGAMVLTDLKTGAAFPTEHPLHGPARSLFLTEHEKAAIRAADLVLSLDWVDLGGFLRAVWGGDPPRVMHCSLDSYSHRGFSAEHQALAPADVRVLADPDLLGEALLSQRSGRAAREPWYRASPGAPTPHRTHELTSSDIGRCLAGHRTNAPLCLVRLPIKGIGPDVYPFAHPLDYLGMDGGGGVGSGPGIAVGAALGLSGSGRVPVAVLGDGDYLMGVTALWTAAKYRIPLLIVIANNRSYGNDEEHQETVARDRDRPVANRWIGQRLENPEADLAQLARAQGWTGLGPIRDRRALDEAIAKGLDTVLQGGRCVIDVHVATN